MSARGHGILPLPLGGQQGRAVPRGTGHLPAQYRGGGHPPAQRSLRASRSDSSRVRTSPSRTGPFTLRMMERLVSSMNSTRTCGTERPQHGPARPSGGTATRPGPLTCVHCPWEPVRPSTLVTCGQRARRQPTAPTHGPSPSPSRSRPAPWPA